MVILDFVLLLLSVSLPHLEFRQRFTRSRFAALGLIKSFVYTDPLAREEIDVVAILVLWGSNPIWISDCPRLQLNNVLYTQRRGPRSRLRMVLRDGLFVHLDNFDDLITILHGHPNFIDNPRTLEGPLRKCFVSAFAIRFALVCAQHTQAKHQTAVAAIRQHWMLETLGRWDATFYQSFFPLHVFPILARLTHMNYGVSHGKFETFKHVRIETHHIHVL